MHILVTCSCVFCTDLLSVTKVLSALRERRSQTLPNFVSAFTIPYDILMFSCVRLLRGARGDCPIQVAVEAGGAVRVLQAMRGSFCYATIRDLPSLPPKCPGTIFLYSCVHRSVMRELQVQHCERLSKLAVAQNCQTLCASFMPAFTLRAGLSWCGYVSFSSMYCPNLSTRSTRIGLWRRSSEPVVMWRRAPADAHKICKDGVLVLPCLLL